MTQSSSEVYYKTPFLGIYHIKLFVIIYHWNYKRMQTFRIREMNIKIKQNLVLIKQTNLH